jgi:hypothetical protein
MIMSTVHVSKTRTSHVSENLLRLVVAFKDWAEAQSQSWSVLPEDVDPRDVDLDNVLVRGESEAYVLQVARNLETAGNERLARVVEGVLDRTLYVVPCDAQASVDDDALALQQLLQSIREVNARLSHFEYDVGMPPLSLV